MTSEREDMRGKLMKEESPRATNLYMCASDGMETFFSLDGGLRVCVMLPFI